MDNLFWHITKLHQSVIENKKKIGVAIPAPVSGLNQWINFKTYKLFNQKVKLSVKCVQTIKSSKALHLLITKSSVFHKEIQN